MSELSLHDFLVSPAKQEGIQLVLSNDVAQTFHIMFSYPFVEVSK